MIQRQDNLPKNCFTKEFVAKVRQQQRVRKATEYSECKEYFHRIGIKSERQYYAWCKHNRQTRTKLHIPPHDPNVTYKNCGWTTWYEFFGKQPLVTVDTQLPYIDCAKLVQEQFVICSKTEFGEWSTANLNLRKTLGIPSTPSWGYKGKGLITWDFFLGKLPPHSACINITKQKKCVYGVNETQCNRCKILNQECITPVAKYAWKKKQDYRNEKKPEMPKIVHPITIYWAHLELDQEFVVFPSGRHTFYFPIN